MIILILGVYLYQLTNGFNKEFKTLEASINGEELKDVSGGNLWVLNGSYVVKFKDNLSREINYEYEIIPVNDFKFKIGNNYYSWLNVYDKSNFVYTNKKNLNNYFVLEEQQDYLILKPTKMIFEIITENTDKKENEIEFPNINPLSDFFVLKLKVGNKEYQYSFGIKESEVVS